MIKNKHISLLGIKPAFEFLFESKSPHIVVVACRGAGKTVAALQYTMMNLFQGSANFEAVFFSPTLRQAKRNIDADMRHFLGNLPENMYSVNETTGEYKFYMGRNDTRKLSLRSYKTKDENRGSHPDVIILDECAQMAQGMFGNIIKPMMKPTSKLIAIGTPQGKNDFYNLYQRGLSERFPTWESYMIKASSHNILDKEFLFTQKNDLSAAEYAQEYECDFEANVLVGAVYGEFFRKYTDNNINDTFEYNPNLPVWTAWDLGFSDYTAIWFFQVNNDVVTFIDYLEDSGKEIAFYANELMRKPYFYRQAILPHDGGAKNIRGAPISVQLEMQGLRTITLRNDSEQWGIDEARRLLKTARFNLRNCEEGILHLKSFRYKQDPHSGVKLQKTVHDEHSHCADAFRYAACSRDIWSKSSQSMTNKLITRMDYNVFS